MGAYFRLLWFTVDNLVKPIECQCLMSVLYINSCFNVLRLTPSFFSDRRRKMKRPTLRSATNLMTLHSQQPVSPKEMAPTLPCLQWRPRSVDHCSASPGLGRRLREQHMGVVLQWVGFTHTRRLFCYPKGGGG